MIPTKKLIVMTLVLTIVNIALEKMGVYNAVVKVISK